MQLENTEKNFFLQIAERNKKSAKRAREEAISSYLAKFILEKGVSEDDKKALISSFIEMSPVDVQDAMYCANIVYSQQMISELSKYRKMYEKYQITSTTAGRNYKWAFEQHRQAVRTLDELIISREKYREDKNG